MTDDLKATNVRLSADLLDAIDRRAKTVGISRNAWLEKSLRWVIHNLPTGMSSAERVAAVQAAPPEVTGTFTEDMGLDGPDGKRVLPPDGHWHRRTSKPVNRYDNGDFEYGCTHEGCTWTVVEDPQGHVLMRAGEMPETEVEKTRRLHKENSEGNQKKRAATQAARST
jgi:hypothetical protein